MLPEVAEERLLLASAGDSVQDLLSEDPAKFWSHSPSTQECPNKVPYGRLELFFLCLRFCGEFHNRVTWLKFESVPFPLLAAVPCVKSLE